MLYMEEYRKLIDIVFEEATKVGAAVVDVLGSRRTKGVALARQRAMKRIYEELPLSYQEIGNFFRRHHTTVLYAAKKT